MRRVKTSTSTSTTNSSAQAIARTEHLKLITITCKTSLWLVRFNCNLEDRLILMYILSQKPDFNTLLINIKISIYGLRHLDFKINLICLWCIFNANLMPISLILTDPCVHKDTRQTKRCGAKPSYAYYILLHKVVPFFLLFSIVEGYKNWIPH